MCSVDDLRQACHGGRLKDDVQCEFDAQALADLGDQLRREQRVAAELEKSSSVPTRSTPMRPCQMLHSSRSLSLDGAKYETVSSGRSCTGSVSTATGTGTFAMGDGRAGSIQKRCRANG